MTSLQRIVALEEREDLIFANSEEPRANSCGRGQQRPRAAGVSRITRREEAPALTPSSVLFFVSSPPSGMFVLLCGGGGWREDATLA